MVDAAQLARRGPERTLLMRKAHEFALATPGGCKGLRVDSILEFGDAVFWVDMGATHATQISLLQPVTKWVQELSAASREAGGVLRANAMLMEPSPAVRRACNRKHDAYKPLLDVAAAQVKAGSRTHMPVFVAGIVTHTGEMAPELITLVESITMQFARTITPSDLEDGLSRSRRTGFFRARFKDALMVAMAEGFGRTLVAAGKLFNPYCTKRSTLEGYTPYLTSSQQAS
jgi:hypothetical protein